MGVGAERWCYHPQRTGSSCFVARGALGVQLLFAKGFGVFALLMIGMLASMLLGSGMDQFAAAEMEEANWLAYRDVRGWVFPTIMPWIFNGSLPALIVVAALARDRSPWTFAAAAVLCAAAILITVRIEVSMNHAISSWAPGAASAGWMSVRDRWLHMHLLRTM